MFVCFHEYMEIRGITLFSLFIVLQQTIFKLLCGYLYTLSTEISCGAFVSPLCSLKQVQVLMRCFLCLVSDLQNFL